MQRPPIAIVALGVFASFAALIPIAYLLVRLSEGWESAALELTRPSTFQLLGNTVLLTIAVGLSALLVGFSQAWLTTRTNLPFTGFFAVLATLPLAFPSYVLALAFTTAFPGFQGFFASWLTLTIATAPYVFLAVSVALVRINVTNEEVARSLGAGRWRVIRDITWPQVRPAAFASLLLVVMYTLSEFGAVAILRYDTFTRAIYNAYRGSFDRTAAAALALVLVLITLLVLYFERRYRGSYTTVPQAMRRNRIDLGGARFLAAGFLVVIAVVAVLVPAGAITYWSVVGSSETNWSELLAALGSSLLVASASGALIAVFAVAIAVWNLRFRSRWSGLVEDSVWVAHALPAVVVGLALVFLGANWLPNLYQTIWLLMFAYLILFLPNALSAMSTPIAQVPPSLEQVARSLGQSRNSTIVKVLLPAARSGLIAGAALAALAVLKELPATLLLHPTGMDTLATELWQATENLSYAKAAPYALALVIIAGVPALVLNQQARKLISEVASK